MRVSPPSVTKEIRLSRRTRVLDDKYKGDVTHGGLLGMLWRFKGLLRGIHIRI